MYYQCSRCVLDSREVPDLFLKDDVCQYCLTWQEKEKERLIEKTNLPWRLDEIRRAGKGKKYDVVLGLSGGVDSSMCLHYLKENDIRVLTFSVDNGYNTPESDENIMKLVEGLKVPFERYTLNLDKFKDLQMAFLKSGVKNCEIPTDHVLMAVSYEMALKHDVSFIVSGGNHATEGIMPDSYGYSARDLWHIKSIYRKFSSGKIGVPTMSLLKYIYCRFIKGIKIVNLLDYYEYNRDAAIKLLEKKYGYKSYGEKHCENIFTMWFQNFYLLKKHGLDKRRPHYSSLVNSGQMTRSEACQRLLERVEYPDSPLSSLVDKITPHQHTDYPSSKWLWDLLGKIYALLKIGK